MSSGAGRQVAAKRRCVTISADGHCGAKVEDYKPYLTPNLHDDFDRWSEAYKDPWGELDDTEPIGRRVGFASYEAPLNWDSLGRLQYTEEQGITAEVLFPNTAPPFYPSGAISAPAPKDRQEYEYRFAGLQAHNRWLVDFCQDAPGRRAGIAHVFLDDVDAAVREVRWAKEAGLKGVLLPSDHVTSMAGLYYPEYEPVWRECAEIGMPVHRHAIKPTEDVATGGVAAPLIGSFESRFYQLRAVAHMILAGVFERYPGLRFVTTEPAASHELITYLRRLDGMTTEARYSPSAVALRELRRKPSEYFATNCYVGGPLDLRTAHDCGVPNLMWGADFPHGEGTCPYNREAMRAAMADLPSEEIYAMVCARAADVYDLDVEKLQPIADRSSPSINEIARRLSPEECPKYPQDTRSAAFAEYFGEEAPNMMMERAE